MIKAIAIRYISIGMLTMLVPILLQSRWQKMKSWKGFVVAVIGTVAGTLGTMALYWIENRRLGGISFYGAVFAVPAVMLILSKKLEEPYERVMDLCAPAAAAMQCVMKLGCLAGGCCDGRILPGGFRFPSQMAEFGNGLVIMLVLLAMAKKKPGRGDLYPWFMVIYGCSRFALNLLREQQDSFLLGLPAGNFWSVVALVCGILWLIRIKRKQT